MKKPKVACLTTFYAWIKTYSLTTVLENQLISLVKYGYSPVLFVLPSFTDDALVPKGVEIRKVIPQIILEPYHAHIFDHNAPVPEQFEEDKKKVITALDEHLGDIDIAITHDWSLVDDYMVYAAALAETHIPHLRVFNWIHSAPSARYDGCMEYPWKCQYTIAPNHRIVYLNNTDALMVAERYGNELKNVRIVHNPIDARTFFKPDELVSKMIDQFGLLDADILQVYPVSTPRMVENKQVDKVIRIFGKLKKLGRTVRLVVCNAHANQDREKMTIDNMKALAEQCGLDLKKEIIFTSLINPPTYEHGVSHDIVKDLFLLSNLFIFPTTSENAPLILLEAASARNLLVLNDDFLPLREFFGESALYFKFSSLRQQTKYTDEEQYYEDVAKIINSELKYNKPLQAFRKWKQNYNSDFIFLHEIEPMLNEGMEVKP